MLGLVAAQLQYRCETKPEGIAKPVWLDVGSGTGYNLELMARYMDIGAAFEHIYLVDLSTSLCNVARARVERLGLPNVTVLCADARSFQLPYPAADIITMSYSLSMIPDYYSVVDALTTLLADTGIIAACDFYVQSIVDISCRNYTGGTFNRHVNWLGRLFWRAWFDADRVNLDGGRRDYLEYKFGTVASASDRNYYLGGIPYYIFLGCPQSGVLRTQEAINKLDAGYTESPYLSAKEYRNAVDRAAEEEMQVMRSKAYESAIINMSAKVPLPSAFYQNNPWRISYNDLLQKHQQFGNEYIYAFNWEDPRVDCRLLNINTDDVILTITSAGDNIMEYLLENPRRIHAVDLNPNQNHLLELKVAAFNSLSYSDTWKLFADGRHKDFRDILIHRLSPFLSSQALQYWLNHASVFISSHGLYESGGSRHAVRLARYLAKMCGLTSEIRTMCNVDTLNEQKEIWPKMRKVLLSWPLHYLIVGTEWFAWKALGVPANQRALIQEDYELATGENTSMKTVSGEAIWQYMVDTLDPVAEKTLLSNDNYFYNLCLQGKYSKK